MNNKLSIIVTSYGNEKTLKNTLESVISNMIDSDELIIIDDGTEDDSLNIARTQAMINNDKNIKIIQKEHQGVSQARNTGVQVATGDWVTFVDGDDMLRPNALNSIRPYLEQNNPVIFTAFRNVYNDEMLNEYLNEPAIVENSSSESSYNIYIQNFLGKWYWNPGCAYYRKDFVMQWFDPTMVSGEDTVFWMRLMTQMAYGKQEATVLTFKNKSNPFLYIHRKGSITDHITNGDVTLEQMKKIALDNTRMINEWTNYNNPLYQLAIENKESQFIDNECEHIKERNIELFAKINGQQITEPETPQIETKERPKNRLLALFHRSES